MYAIRSYYANCHISDLSQQCIDAGYSKTSCSTGYTLSGACPYSPSYYSSCVCHTDCTEMYQDAVESKADSSDMFANDLDWSGTVITSYSIHYTKLYEIVIHSLL